jgi:hypothetical protein
MGLLFDFIEVQLSAGRSVIAESNFCPSPFEDGRRLVAIRDKYRARVFEVHRSGAPEVVLSRFARRQCTDERHPGHVMEASDYGELEARLRDGFFHPMVLRDGSLVVDTTEFDGVDHESIANAVLDAMGNG